MQAIGRPYPFAFILNHYHIENIRIYKIVEIGSDEDRAFNIPMLRLALNMRSLETLRSLSYLLI
jgi:hypothetical protein